MSAANIPGGRGTKTRVRRFWRAITIADNMIARHCYGECWVSGCVKSFADKGAICRCQYYEQMMVIPKVEAE
jgi:hypothetical protein